MNIWLIKDGENLPVQSGSGKMRMWMLADQLVSRGHSVTWWSSSFSHQRKELLYDKDVAIEVGAHFKLKLLCVGGYKKNISLRRRLHHCRLAYKFSRQAKIMTPPDAIVCAFPTIDLAYEVMRYSRFHQVALIIDIRDLWPDIFVDKSPVAIKLLVKILLWNDFWKRNNLLRFADSIVAVSKGYLEWGLRSSGRAQNENNMVFYIGNSAKSDIYEKASERIHRIIRDIGNKVVFTFIGSFGLSYELRLICEVARKISEMNIGSIHFVLAGDGEQYLDISKRARFLTNITLTGWLDISEVGILLKHSDVGLVAQAMAKDTMPNKSFEYLSAGLPLLSSLKGEMEKIIADNEVGYSYQSGDGQSLLTYIVNLAHDEKLRKRLKENAKRLFEREFRADSIYARYAKHVEKIASIKNKTHV